MRFLKHISGKVQGVLRRPSSRAAGRLLHEPPFEALRSPKSSGEQIAKVVATLREDFAKADAAKTRHNGVRLKLDAADYELKVMNDELNEVIDGRSPAQPVPAASSVEPSRLRRRLRLPAKKTNPRAA